MISNDWYFGIDAGATKTRLYARTESGTSDLEFLGGPANVLRQGIEQTASLLSSLINKALDKIPGGSLRAVHAGIAGASLPSIQEKLIRHIRLMTHSKRPLHITISHDGVIALEGALAGKRGLVFIAGTGSGVMARTGPDLSEYCHVGGWGYLIGDEGSGYTIGRRAMTAIAQALDGGPETQLTQLAKSHLNIHDRQSLLRVINQPDWKFQDMAPLTLEAAENGDVVASSVVNKETNMLAEQAHLILRKHPNLTPTYTIIGGLSNHKYYEKRLCAAMEKIWPIAKYISPDAPPAEGAVRIAIRQSTDSASVQ